MSRERALPSVSHDDFCPDSIALSINSSESTGKSTVRARWDSLRIKSEILRSKDGSWASGIFLSWKLYFFAIRKSLSVRILFFAIAACCWRLLILLRSFFAFLEVIGSFLSFWSLISSWRAWLNLPLRRSKSAFRRISLFVRPSFLKDYSKFIRAVLITSVVRKLSLIYKSGFSIIVWLGNRELSFVDFPWSFEIRNFEKNFPNIIYLIGLRSSMDHCMHWLVGSSRALQHQSQWHPSPSIQALLLDWGPTWAALMALQNPRCVG